MSHINIVSAKEATKYPLLSAFDIGYCKNLSTNGNLYKKIQITNLLLNYFIQINKLLLINFRARYLPYTNALDKL